MDQTRFPKPDLELLRVSVYVHTRRVDLEIQHVCGLAPVKEHVAIGEAHRACDQLVAQRPAVQEEMLLIGLAARVRGKPEPAREPHTRAIVIEPHRLRDEVLAEYRRDTRIALAIRNRRRVIRKQALAAAEPECNVEAGERSALDEPLHLCELGPLGAQELAARGYVEEELAHLDRRALGVRRWRGTREHSVRGCYGVAGLRASRTGDESDTRHRGDRGQRFAAEPERAHRLQVLDARKLARRVMRKRELELIARDPGAVVAHAAKRDASGLDFDLDAARVGIQAVLDQLLHHRRRPFDDLAGRDLVNELFGQDPDGHASGPRGGGREDSKARSD